LKDERFPSAPQAFLLVLALFLAQTVVGAALYDGRRLLELTPAELDAFVALLGNAVIFVVLMHAKSMSFRELFHPARHSALSTAVLVAPPVAMLVPMLLLVADQMNEWLVRLLPLSSWGAQAFERMAGTSLAATVASCVLAPVLEEMLFRGIILRAFLLQYTRWNAIFGSALLFGFAHLNIYQFVVAFMLGGLAGWLYERTRSLIPCIALHAFYNSAISVLESLSRAEAAAFGATAAQWGTASLLALAGGAALRRLLARP